MPCSWCGTDAKAAIARHEGPHATWCVHFREAQRGGWCPRCRTNMADPALLGTKDEGNICGQCWQNDRVTETQST